MPTVNENKQKWSEEYQWANQGDEWSGAWGGPDMQWYGSILPRIHRFFPAESILEIACGYGRWTHYLKDMCSHLIAIDLSSKCVDTCKARFRDCKNIEYHVNDGKCLDGIPDTSIDFVFSFDSLVHADQSVLAAYIGQLPRILKANGRAFIHHSNLGAYRTTNSINRRIPKKLVGALKLVGLLEKSLHWRDPTVSADLVAALAARSGLSCVAQEVLPWGTRKLQIDCFTTIMKGTSEQPERQFLRNATFMSEVRAVRRLAPLYGSRGS